MNTKKLFSLLLTLALLVTGANLTAIAGPLNELDTEGFHLQDDFELPTFDELPPPDAGSGDKTAAVQAWAEKLGLTLADIDALLETISPTKLSLELRRLGDFKEYNNLTAEQYGEVRTLFLSGMPMAEIEESYIFSQVNNISLAAAANGEFTAEEAAPPEEQEEQSEVDINLGEQEEPVPTADEEENFVPQPSDAPQEMEPATENTNAEQPPSPASPVSGAQEDETVPPEEQEEVQPSQAPEAQEEITMPGENTEYAVQYEANKAQFYENKAEAAGLDAETAETQTLAGALTESYGFTPEQAASLLAAYDDEELLFYEVQALHAAFFSQPDYDSSAVRAAFVAGTSADRLVGAKTGLLEQGTANPAASDIVAFARKIQTICHPATNLWRLEQTII